MMCSAANDTVRMEEVTGLKKAIKFKQLPVHSSVLSIIGCYVFLFTKQTVSSTFKPDVVPAVNRWLKKAGDEGIMPAD